MTTRTITPEDAEDLADTSDGNMAGEWCREADVLVDTGRWREERTLVLRHDDGTVWGLDYARGLTENQDSSYPWRDADGPLNLRRLHRTERIVVRYSNTPPPDPEVSTALVDRVYDVLFAALGEHDLISCPTTETGPANGIESGHVYEIAERVARTVQTLTGEPVAA